LECLIHASILHLSEIIRSFYKGHMEKIFISIKYILITIC